MNHEQPLLLSRNETARLMGVSLGSLEKMLRLGEVPYRRLGRRILIPRDYVERFAKGCAES
jgi:excisionase family DNA binding protein